MKRVESGVVLKPKDNKKGNETRGKMKSRETKEE